MVTTVDVYKEIRRLQLEGVTSQRQVAKTLGISRNTVKKYWNGDSVPWEKKEYNRSPTVLTSEVQKFIASCLNEDEAEGIAYSVCILPPARYFSATLPNKTRHRAGAVCHCIAGAKALPEVCVLAKPLRQRCNWSINLHRRNWQPM